jgi:coenzyme F420-0:L-glutamate ligase/coenzyme F420-1:gamma-L-glutamate ligase
MTQEPMTQEPITRPAALTCLPVDGLGEVVEGDDLAALLAEAVVLADGDILVLTSKAVSKAEGRVVAGTREDLLAAETDRVVARRGPTSIVRTHHGLVLAAAGIDGSNTEAGTVVLLPRDPDASARALRARLRERGGGVAPAVVITDSFGRAWRVGQCDVAIGAAGLAPVDDWRGRRDGAGRELTATIVAVADEAAAAADLARSKDGGEPAVLVRGLERFVTAGDGPGAVALVRARHEDLFL